ncbi:MAG TPA: trifunctional transcriptional regulator/proline dehydrogenase/L-glutamate gamma-semialdehyde dehydrogenase [Caldimonas sp.]|nr:trifunctional transcriptional regulator/proline dehydrogenase/L-glutamate gamma-semialdehyde dehydrogenase [Caldimonas sp.]HEV7578331.1 trifunctional transcriptional regulator/proline dehydrogenase/L-glutamate gamma-semialdehyde dehydrogenase [Caldimonas sp.]
MAPHDDLSLPAARSPLRAAVTAAYRLAEPEAVPPLVAAARLAPDSAAAAQALARRLAQALRDRKSAAGREGLVQGLLQEYSLSSQEGVALMCLAEALLRIPDPATRDALIRDKISTGQWHEHLGRSPSLFVNAATWALLLTGKLVSTHSESGLSNALARLVGKGGEPLIRKSVDRAMRVMGEQFVTGETIADALANARPREAQGFRYSYDMLGEAALTGADAARYRRAYEDAIDAIGRASAGRGICAGPGISIKLSALHPRYSRAQVVRVHDELYPILKQLAIRSRRHDIGLNIDAEEADRLELSLDLLERLCFEPELAGWNGIGFVVQAYQKRCPFVIDALVDLGRRSGHRLMVRLVKGAYWDSEIKRAQIDGLDGYPVYTRKAYTDVAYLACARRLLAAPDATFPQFATHNAHTLAAVHELAGGAAAAPDRYEFQCLHGMGEPLYEQVVGNVADGGLGRPCRIYAPVGTHETLLAYLVRRLLENGANTSFVNRIADASVPIDALIEDPVTTTERIADEEGEGGARVVGRPHPAIALPGEIYGGARRNSRGLDLSNEDALAALAEALQASRAETWTASPLLAAANASAIAAPGAFAASATPAQEILNPADHDDVVGHVREATLADVERAVASASEGAAAWAATPASERAAMLERSADSLEADLPLLLGLLAREAGKTYPNGIAEVREAVDFLRFYAAQARRDLGGGDAAPLGPVVCISPWNFPLAIFTGQVAAALAAGNPVLAKPAEQTPLIAAEMVRRLRGAGLPPTALQLLPGRGETVGAALVADARVQGVMFTGSTNVARLLQKSLAGRLNDAGRAVPLIAETGGQNAMLVDSSALAEQVVSDVVASAFDSAGQRCSALRVLCLQDDGADRVVAMLRGAMAESRIGAPDALAVDVGPVIDAEARDAIEAHVAQMRGRGRSVFRDARAEAGATARGTFVTPTLIELDHLGELEREIFGPVLHVVRYRRRDLGAMIDQVNATGYGLTLGVQSRIDETIAQVVAGARVGNVYVNRNMVGAVVGVQPFGGEGLSGTGPKAGGPLYLYRLLSRRPAAVMSRALAAGSVDASPQLDVAAPLRALRRWAEGGGDAVLAALCTRFASESRVGVASLLAGPTGERNVYTLQPRDAILCLADAEGDRLAQLAAVLAVGSRALWPRDAAALRERLPEPVRARIDLVDDWTVPGVRFDAVLHHGSADGLLRIGRVLAARLGPIVGVEGSRPGETALPLERLVVERALSVNTAAAGGNATLMTLQ